MHNNPETLKYKVGDKVRWRNEDGIQEGTVTNVDFYVLDVLLHGEEIWIPFVTISQKEE